MEKELEILEEEMTNELETVSRRPSKKVVFGIVTVGTIGLFLVFRKKIKAKIEKSTVKKLEKKGYLIVPPIEGKEFQDEIEESLNN